MKVKAENHPVAGVALLLAGRWHRRTTAERLAANGVSVAVADLNARLSEAVAERIISRGGRALPMAVDVTKLAEVNAAVSAAEAALGPIDFLVNTAGHFNGKTQKISLGMTLRTCLECTFSACIQWCARYCLACKSDEQELS